MDGLKNCHQQNIKKKPGKTQKQIRKYFLSSTQDENYELSLSNLSSSIDVIFDFFDNVMVNDQNEAIKKNRLELLQMLRKTYENYLNFSYIESL